MARAEGPFDVGSPADYAVQKARIFPDEGGPAIVEFELPDSVADEMIGGPGLLEAGKALDAGFEIRFEKRQGLELLLAQWPELKKRMIELQ